MQINPDQWAKIREAVELDSQEAFEKMVIEFARIAVAHQRDHAIRCDRVRSRERGRVPYLISER